MTDCGIAQPLYTVYWYSDFVYRVVKFKRSSGIHLPSAPDEGCNDRFSQSYSRARSQVLQIALCNQWDYFVTITVDRTKHDRYDLDSLIKYITQWIRDFRKRTGCKFKYLLVPEHHKKDGAWHFHGLVSGISDKFLSPFVAGIHPHKLVSGGYFNFPELSKSVGFVSLGRIKNPIGSSFYISKYITKEHANDDFYSHLYFCSVGLNRCRPLVDFYAYNSTLENCLTYTGDFCSAGWLFTDDWSAVHGLGGEDRDIDSLFPAEQAIIEALDNFTVEHYEQLSLVGWCNGNIAV